MAMLPLINPTTSFTIRESPQNRAYRAYRAYGPYEKSDTEVIKEIWTGVQVFFQNKDAFFLEDVANLAFGVEQVAEFAGADWTDFDAFGVFALARALDAERAFFDDAFFARAVAEVFGFGVHLVGGNAGVGPIEVARAVGAGGHAAAAADAPIVVDDHDAVFFLPRRADGTDFAAGWIGTVLTGDGEIEFAGLRHGFGVVVGVGVMKIDALLFVHLKDSDPMDLRVARLVVLFDAAIHAAPTADAAGDVQRVGEGDAFLWRRGFDGHGFAELFGIGFF